MQLTVFIMHPSLGGSIKQQAMHPVRPSHASDFLEIGKP